MRTWVVATILLAISYAGCSAVGRNHSQGAWVTHTLTGADWAHWATTQHFESNSFVKMVSLTDRAIIEITFLRDMKAETLNHNTIRVVSEKQARDGTDGLGLEYDPLNRRLTLRPLHPDFNFGTGNLVTVHVSSEVRDVNGTPMGMDFEHSFST
jgi:hypothetical protein